MSYTALYRKYRPTDFEDVRGQEHIVTTLKNQIMSGRIGHAYLFTGTRGTGKTTVAKIFAKAVNCEDPAEGSPCGQCPSCRAIASGASMNVIEIDAASNNGVDNVRQIREEVSYAPTEGKYKVYIIDEVHMLSAGAFNALLKTLEEPPSYVIFILATTEPHKIPITILSRCQRYDFRHISMQTIADRLRELMEKEGAEAEEKALLYVAKAADGSMRDGLSLLDQCLAFYMDEKLTYEHALEVLGAVDTDLFSRLLRSVIRSDVSACIRLVDDLIMQGRELAQFITDFIWYLRNLLLIGGSDEMDDIVDMSQENLKNLKEEAAMVEDAVIMRYIRIFSELSGQLRYSSQKRVLTEIALIKLCRPEAEVTPDSLADRIAHLERRIREGVVVQASGQTDPMEAPREAAPKKQVLPKAIPDDVREVVKNWRSIIQELPGLLRSYLKGVRLSLGGDNRLVLVTEDEMAYAVLMENDRPQQIKDAISKRIGKEVELSITQNETSQPFEESYIDLEKIIHMDIDIED